MEWEELSNATQEKLRWLRGASSTIENDVMDALAEASSEAEFITEASIRLEDLKAECEGWISWLRGRSPDEKKGASPEQKRATKLWRSGGIKPLSLLLRG